VPVHTTINFTDKFYDRFSRLVPSGQRSEFIMRSVNKELDKLESQSTVQTKQEEWLKEVAVPALSLYLKDRSNYQILELYDEDRLDSLIEIISEKIGTTISKEHMRLCLSKVSNDRQQNG